MTFAIIQPKMARCLYAWKLERNLTKGQSIQSPWIEAKVPGRVVLATCQRVEETDMAKGAPDAVLVPRLIHGNLHAFAEGEYTPRLPAGELALALEPEGSGQDGTIRFKLGFAAEEDLPSGHVLWVQIVLWIEAEAAAVLPERVEPLEARLPERSGALEALRPERVYIENPPKVLHRGWMYHLRLAGEPGGTLKTEEIEWTVQEGGGSIDRYGKYTAPDKPGMYEVFALHRPTGLEASAYMIVRE